MNRKALLALCIVALLPVVSYFIVKEISKNAVNMPPRYFADTVMNSIVNGKSETDTIWHTIPNITFTNQLGDQVSLDDVKGKIIVADFFFTKCPSICPYLTKNMKGLQDAMKIKDFRKKIDSSFVQFISFTVDPERDSAQALKVYADKYGVNHDTWWFLTGPKKKIYNFAFDELKLGLVDGKGIDSNFIHTEKFVLLDRERIVRGYYNGLDTASLSKLAEDMTILMLEKDRKKKTSIF
ncbi:MAG: SCO family protein [Flavitalea sp.]